MDDPVCNGCDRRIVGDDNDSRTLLPAHVLENLQHLFAGVIVQCAGGFVTEQDLRVFGNGSGNGNTLLLTAGELCRKVVDAVGKPYVFQNRDRIQGVFHDFRGKLYVFLCRQILHQIVELEHKSHIGAAVCGQLCAAVFGDVLAVDDDFAAVVGVHAAEDVQHRGFSGAGRAQDDGEFALFYGKRNVPVGIDGAAAHVIGLAAVYHFDVSHFSSLLFKFYNSILPTCP